MKYFLDNIGLNYMWSRIKNYLAPQKRYIGTCTSTAGTQNKVVTVDDSFVLVRGVVIAVKFSYSNTFSATASAPVTLNVNNTGAYRIYYNTAVPTGTATSVYGYANRYIYYMFDGTQWLWINYAYESNTTYSAMSATEISEGTATTGRLVTSKVLNDWLSTRLEEISGINGHKYVDMGLPSGTLWATVNIGGTAPQDTGKYFQWGDSVGYFAGQVGGEGKQFTWDDYKWTNDGGTTMTKYNSTDGLTELVAADDAARAEWGDGWRMPTTEQLYELLDTNYVTNAWVTDYNGTGVRGRLFTSKVNGNTLFFPAAGNAYNGNVSGANSRGYYANRDTGGNCMYFSSSSCALAAATRYYGMAVRAVVG